MRPATARRGFGRFLGTSGALLLVVCFFLPMVKGCSGPESPQSLVSDRSEGVFRDLLAGKIESGTGERAALLVGILLPHLFGVVVLLRLAFSRGGRGRADRMVRVLAELFLVTGVVCILGYMMGWYGKYFGSSTSWERFYTGLTWVAAVLVIGWVLWARVRGWPHVRFVLASQQVGGILCLLWFQYWFVGNLVSAVKHGDPPFHEIYYGLPLATLAALLLLLGGVLEGLAPGAGVEGPPGAGRVVAGAGAAEESP